MPTTASRVIELSPGRMRALIRWVHAQKIERSTEKTALVILAANSVRIDGEYRSYTTLDTLNARCSMAIAGRCVKKLQERGLIERRRGPHPDTGRPCNYYVMFADL